MGSVTYGNQSSHSLTSSITLGRPLSFAIELVAAKLGLWKDRWTRRLRVRQVEPDDQKGDVVAAARIFRLRQ